MAYLKAHVRGVTYTISAFGALMVYVGVGIEYTGTLRIIRLEEWYGFIAVGYLLAALLPTPLYRAFPQIPGKPVYGRARRALGISTFCFAALHASIAFFGLLQGFHGIPFLDRAFSMGLVWGLVSLVLLGLMASTSNDVSVRMLGPWWKRLHRFVYVAAALVLIHILTIGSDFTDLSRLIPTIFLILVFSILILELLRVDTTLATRYGYSKRTNIVFMLGAILLVLGYLFITGHGSLSEHAQHLKNLTHD